MESFLRDQYIIAFLWGYLVWGFISSYIVSKVMACVWDKTTDGYKKIGKKVPFYLDNKNREPFKWAPRMIGIIERFFYTSAVVLNQFVLIGIWIAFKIIGEWGDIAYYKNTSDDDEIRDGITRIRANNYLIGNALSLLFGILGGVWFHIALNQNFLIELIQKNLRGY